MSQQKSEDQVRELEQLREVLTEEHNRDDLIRQTVPILTELAAENSQTDAADTFDSQSAERTRPELSLLNSDPATSPTGNQLRERLQLQAKLLIQEIIDEEMVRVESLLNRELNSYLDHLLDQLSDNFLD